MEIFQRYAREWLPVFVMANSKRVNIFDFFAGTGYDVKGVPGSPIRILEEIKGQIDNIKRNGTVIHIYLNEYRLNFSGMNEYPFLMRVCSSVIDAINSSSMGSRATIVIIASTI